MEYEEWCAAGRLSRVTATAGSSTLAVAIELHEEGD